MSGPTGGETTPPFGSVPLADLTYDGRDLTEPLAERVFPRIDLARWAGTRLVIAGVPHAGKTTLGNTLAKRPDFENVRHTDELIGKLSWSEASAEVATWLDAPGPWVIEGVASVRALRKWLLGDPETMLLGHDEGKPCDALIWMWQPIEPLEGRRLGLAKSCRTIYDQIETELAARGVEIMPVFG